LIERTFLFFQAPKNEVSLQVRQPRFQQPPVAMDVVTMSAQARQIFFKHLLSPQKVQPANAMMRSFVDSTRDV